MESNVSSGLQVTVVGAGIVGVCCAILLRRQGAEVTIIDAGAPGGTQAASYGNGGWLSPASIVPMSMPGLWKKVPGYLLDRTGPLTIRPTALPGLAPWLWRFMRAGATVHKVERTARALNVLLHDAPARHRALADAAGLGGLIVHNGLLHVYPDQAAFAADALAWKLRRDNGVRFMEWGARDIRHWAPQLSPRYQFGVWVADGAHCVDPGRYVSGLLEHALALGARFVRGRVSHVDELGTAIVEGEALSADRLIIAAGIHSWALARQLGDDIPLRSERGYHVEIKAPGFELPIPIMPSDGKMANTNTTQGLRFSGQVELAGREDAPDWRRSDILLEHARRLYPQLAERELGDAEVTRWMGHRPSVADGLPVIGPARRTDKVIYAFGHGHIGLVSAPKTAEIVTALVFGAVAEKEWQHYGAGRF